MIIYLHGFLSGPQSAKARILKAHIEKCGRGAEFVCEQLSWEPKLVVQDVSNLIEQNLELGKQVTLIGSSLGGHFVTYLAEKFSSIKAILVNPCVVSYVILEKFLGPQKLLYSNDIFELTQKHLDDLKFQQTYKITFPERYWLLVEKGDKVLDYRQAVLLYANAKQTILEGGNHYFTQWHHYLDEILQFADKI